ncbi:hypothetical protein CPT_Muldoon_100 [Serratia phage Muldoon]|uniref:Uncharacterized protein n=1 Tax=Serratia phage Muldoon TaxID=2601678 RepID=A0A5P8PHC2_9CAUD|nr:hypothetical protein HYP94_gp099 [Serratia phage Muldoon]QFR56055.1 hypothetical protein CPT_Muldoon_100 [Serratia phage Muldoon]
MSRTIRRKGWTYWESTDRRMVGNNPLFGNKGWIMKSDSVNEAYRYWMAGESLYYENVAEIIHRDIKKSWRRDAHKSYLTYNKYGIRSKQRAGLKKVMEGFEYLVDEKAIMKSDRGIAEWE